MRRRFGYPLAMLMVLFMTACQSGAKSASPSASAGAPITMSGTAADTAATATVAAVVATPTAPSTTFVSPFTSPFTSPLSPLVTPAAAATVLVPTVEPLVCKPATGEVGAIYGRALLADGRPFGQATLYLGKWEGQDTKYPAIMLDTGNSPKAITDDQGRYCFTETEPGTYGLIIWEVVESFLVGDPKTGYTLQVEVKKGETTTLPDASRP